MNEYGFIDQVWFLIIFYLFYIICVTLPLFVITAIITNLMSKMTLKKKKPLFPLIVVPIIISILSLVYMGQFYGLIERASTRYYASRNKELKVNTSTPTKQLPISLNISSAPLLFLEDLLLSIRVDDFFRPFQ